MPEHGADAPSKSMSEPQERVKAAFGLHTDYYHVRDNNRHADPLADPPAKNKLTEIPFSEFGRVGS
jgi:hypothetical protein